jgi:2-amino-4-hydroxy-6-hydroxymethyldihydropteridine diphosphokinase
MDEREHQVCIVLGSNIEPAENIRKALRILQGYGRLERISTTWETPSFGSPGPNFLNTAVLFRTKFNAADLKYEVLRPIESQLGRVRTANKNAPRTIDLDIVLFDGQVVDPKLWSRPFLVITVAELFPDLVHTETGRSLASIAHEMRKTVGAVPHPELPTK